MQWPEVNIKNGEWSGVEEEVVEDQEMEKSEH